MGTDRCITPCRAVLAALLAAACAATASPALANDARAVPGRAVVGLRGGAHRIVSTQAAARLRGAPGVRYVEPDYVYSASAVPNDPLFAQQWQLADPSVLGASAAWDQTLGDGVVVAVLDTGVNLSHPDLAPNLWTNPGEIPGNGIDDDHDGYVDDVHGANVLAHTGDPSDDEGHGTHVAGTIAARGFNGVGVTGVAPDAQIMPVKVLDDHRNGSATSLADGILYAVAHGAKIINASVNGDGRSTALEDAIKTAQAAGVTIVASSGNDGRDIDLLPSYPAAYPEDNIVSVGSTGHNGAISSFSNIGLKSVDITAPGEDVLSTASDGGYELRSGTSMSAPEVAGALALLASANPGNSQTTDRQALLAGARKLPILGALVNGGALDLAGALRNVVPSAAWHGSQAPLALAALLPTQRRAGRVVLRWTLGGDVSGIATIEVELDGRAVAQLAPTAPPQVRVSAKAGRHVLRVVAIDATGAPLATTQRSFRLATKRA